VPVCDKAEASLKEGQSGAPGSDLYPTLRKGGVGWATRVNWGGLAAAMLNQMVLEVVCIRDSCVWRVRRPA
jgi:hypothetical protein